jgi:hypothetical protein
MMNNILFNKQANKHAKKKYIENAVIRIPLSQLITVDCTIQDGKMVLHSSPVTNYAKVAY